jgi:hypothetical protein
MFGKKKKVPDALHRESRQKTEAKPAKLTQREIMTNIEQLGQGEALS